ERIPRVARRAPRAVFAQCRRVLIVTDTTLKARGAEGADEESYADIGYGGGVSQCGAQLIPCISERLYHERYQQPDKLEDGKELTWPVPYWWLDIGCTVMLIILAAIDEGLASGFAGPFPHPKGMDLIRSALRIPEHFTPVGIMPVGYPLPDTP